MGETMRYEKRGAAAALLAFAFGAGCAEDARSEAESARERSPEGRGKADQGEQPVPTPRIVGGSATLIAQVPWQVSLQNRYGYHSCGGSIVHERWIVTAAHCVDHRVPSDLQIVAGRTRLRDQGGQTRAVVQLISHASYVTPTLGYDIALLELDEPLDLSGSDARAIPMMSSILAEQGVTAPGTDALVSGWGALRASGGSPDRLQSVSVPIVSDELADEAYNQYLGPTQIAAGLLGVGGADACQGDSGGPLVVAHPDGGYVLAGVVSWGSGCGDARYPGMYARVSALRSWIDERMGPDAIEDPEDDQLDPPVAPPVGAIGVAITEVLTAPRRAVFDANGDGFIGERGDEFIEIINSGTAPYALGGTSLSDARRPRFVFPAGTTLEPGELAVVFGDGEPAAIAGAKVFAARGALALNNAGETITLRASDGGVISTLEVPDAIESSWAWDPIAGVYADHTSFSREPASPGSLGEGGGARRGLVLSEICPNPGSEDDLNGDGYRTPYEEEFVEVWNRGALPLQLGAYELRVDGRAIALPDRTLEPGASHVVFGGGSSAAIERAWGDRASVVAPHYFWLPNDEAIVELARAGGGEAIDALYYVGAARGLSAHRASFDDDEIVEAWSAPTPGQVSE